MTHSKPERRKKLIVLSGVQRRIILRTALVPCVGLLSLTAIATYRCFGVMDEAKLNQIELAGIGPLVTGILFGAVAMSVLIVWQAVYFSHRIGGPTHRIVQTMRTMAQTGEREKVQLRPGDFLVEIADEFNELLATLPADEKVSPQSTAGHQLTESASDGETATVPSEAPGGVDE